MDIRYGDKKLRELCEKKAVAQRKLGAACAKKLIMRMQQIEAAARVRDLVAGNPHPLKGDRAGQFSLNLDGGWRLLFVSANEPTPQKDDGSIDWDQVTIICIEFIGDHHP